MKIGYWALIVVALSSVSNLFFEYYMSTYYNPEAEPDYIIGLLIQLLLLAVITLGTAGAVWLFKRSAYFNKLYSSIVCFGVVFIVVNSFAIYLMHWTVNR